MRLQTVRLDVDVLEQVDLLVDEVRGRAGSRLLSRSALARAAVEVGLASPARVIATARLRRAAVDHIRPSFAEVSPHITDSGD